MKRLLCIIVLSLVSCVQQQEIATEEPQKEINTDFYYTLEQAENALGIKMHEPTDSAFLKAKKVAENFGERFVYNEPSYSMYIKFRPLHRACINSYVNFKTLRKVRCLEITHQDLLGKPKNEYISDLTDLYGRYTHFFKIDNKNSQKEITENYFWPVNQGAIELEYAQRKKRKSNNIEFSCTVKFMDHGTYINEIRRLSSQPNYVTVESPLIFTSFPVFTTKSEVHPHLLLTLDKVEEKLGVKLNGDGPSSLTKLRSSPGYKKSKYKEALSFVSVDLGDNYSANVSASSRWHKDKKIHSITMKYNNEIAINRKYVLTKLKEIYGDYSYAYLRKSDTHYSVNYLWSLPNGTGLKYNYSSGKYIREPHNISFLTNTGYLESYNSHINHLSENKEIFR